jgi:AcrR family transcriptional regulator
VDDVIEAAKNTFWSRGYEATAISDLERSTGLSRSSLYLSFGSKRSLFESTLDRYLQDFIDPLIRTLDAPGAGLADVLTFFSAVNETIVHDPRRRGCLMVNTMASQSIELPETQQRATAYRNRLRQAFLHALDGAAAAGHLPIDATRHRAWLLTAATFGIWISARLDPTDASQLCRAVVSEVESWDSRAAS